jgi:hypothetical protein
LKCTTLEDALGGYPEDGRLRTGHYWVLRKQADLKGVSHEILGSFFDMYGYPSCN